MIAEIGRANGLDLYSENNGAIHRLVSKVLAGQADPSSFAKAAGEAQEPLDASANVWMPIYSQNNHDPKLQPYLRQGCPFVLRILGGNVTDLLGQQCPAR